MKRTCRLALGVLLTCASPACGFAAEGFFTDKAPPAVRAIWPSVYAFVCEGNGSVYTASAFLVGKANSGTTATYYFMTAGHAIEDCRSPRRYLTEDVNRPRFESDGITLAAAPQRLDSVSTVYVDDAYDLAVVKVEASAALRIGNPVRAGDQCDKAVRREVYAVGFPGVGKRLSLRLNRDAKRWSKGRFVGYGKAEFRGVESLYIASSVDSLPGSSGGPVVDENGELIGVVAKGAASAENAFRYDVDAQKKDDWQTFLVPCRAVSAIIQRSGIGK
jgi:S1-C subfamily serine protease